MRMLIAAILMIACTLLSLGTIAQQPGGRGFNTSSLDKNFQPCQDFNQFANGGWIAANPVPAAFPEWGRFDELTERNRDTLHQILEDAAKNTKAANGSNEQKIGDYFASFMDEAKIESEGIKPLQPELDRITAVKDLKSLQSEIAHLHSVGVYAMFDFNAAQDRKNSTQVIGEASQGGLGLPDRDYYLKDDEKSKKIRDAYLKYVASLFELMGSDAVSSAANAKGLMALETKLAGASMTRVELRDPNTTYHRMVTAELKTLTPDFSWKDYFKNISESNITAINMAQPEFFKELNHDLSAVSLDEWKTYLRFHLVNRLAPGLSSKFVDANFDFYSRTLTGTNEMLPRWKRGVANTDRALGEALGQLYVEKTFTPEAKAHALEMVNNLISALRADLSTLSWMDDTTRKQATLKLDAFAKKIGYPDKWRDYSSLKIDRSSYITNRLRARQFEIKRDLNKIGKPVDRSEWDISPPTVNAFYNPQMNEIVFPAGILQSPFYDPNADDAINYGGIGAVIGHEMTHGFDDEGRQFDADGNLKNWWSDADLKNFNDRASCVVKQFDSFVVDAKDNIHQNGKLVLGESIADLGGLTVAYAAFEKSLVGKPRPANIDGFTPEQRFFLGWAQVWADNIRPEYTLLLNNLDPHPLARFRINGPLSNLTEFGKAFDCKEGDPMTRPEKDRCRIW